MTTYVFRNGRCVDKRTGEPLHLPSGSLATPMLAPIMPAYASPIDGRMITSRYERAEDMKRNNCVDGADLPSPTGGKIRNAAFAAKRGLKVSEEFR